MKKLFAAILCITLAFILVSCDYSLSPYFDDIEKRDSGTNPEKVEDWSYDYSSVTDTVKEKVTEQKTEDNTEPEQETFPADTKEEKEDVKDDESLWAEYTYENRSAATSLPENAFGSSDGITDEYLPGPEADITMTPYSITADEAAQAAGLIYESVTAMINDDGLIDIYFNDPETGLQGKTETIETKQTDPDSICFDETGNLWFSYDKDDSSASAGSKTAQPAKQTEKGMSAGKTKDITEDPDIIGYIDYAYLTGENGSLPQSIHFASLDENEDILFDIKPAENGIAVLTDSAVRLYEASEKGPVQTGAAKYNKDSLSDMTIMDSLIFFTDGLSDLVIMNSESGESVITKPLFENGEIPDSSVVVYSTDGETYSVIVSGRKTGSVTVKRYDISGTAGTCEVNEIWTSSPYTDMTNLILSVADGKIYSYAKNNDGYGFLALDFASGKEDMFAQTSSLESFAPLGEMRNEGCALAVDTQMGTVAINDRCVSVLESSFYRFPAGSVSRKMISEETFAEMAQRSYIPASPLISATLSGVNEKVTLCFSVTGLNGLKSGYELFTTGTGTEQFVFCAKWELADQNGQLIDKNTQLKPEQTYTVRIEAQDGGKNDSNAETGTLTTGMVLTAVN